MSYSEYLAAQSNLTPEVIRELAEYAKRQAQPDLLPDSHGAYAVQQGQFFRGVQWPSRLESKPDDATFRAQYLGQWPERVTPTEAKQLIAARESERWLQLAAYDVAKPGSDKMVAHRYCEYRQEMVPIGWEELGPVDVDGSTHDLLPPQNIPAPIPLKPPATSHSLNHGFKMDNALRSMSAKRDIRHVLLPE